MTWLLQAAGTGFILLAVADVVLTVLHPRSGTGLISPRVQRMLWRGIIRAAKHWPKRSQRFLSLGGPLMMLTSVGTWVSMLLAGSALVIWPELGSGVNAVNGPTPTDFVTALYYAGVSLATLGLGDLAPTSGGTRLFTIMLALIGFSIVTLTLTYFMSIYAALIRRNVVSQTMHNMSGGSGRSADLVAAFGSGGKFNQSRSQIATIGTGVLDIVESNEAYPVLQYFRMKHSRYAVARVALLALDSASLIKSALAPANAAFVHSSAVRLVWGAGLSLLSDAEGAFMWGPEGRETEEVTKDADVRTHFEAALATLRDAGIETRADVDSAFHDYCSLRGEWLPRVVSLARCTGFPWADIAGSELDCLGSHARPRPASSNW